MGNRSAATVLGVAAMLAVSLFASRADAHAIGLSTGEYTAKGSSVQAKLAFARGEVASLLPTLDANRDGHITAIEVESAKRDLEAKVLGRVEVSAAGAKCTPLLGAAMITEQDGIGIEGAFDCGRPASQFDVHVALLDDLAHGHRHVARGVGATTHDEVLYKDHASFTIATATAPIEPASAVSPSTHAKSAWGFFEMGIEHILTGYDHLVFLLGLILLRAKVRQLLAVVTAFTLAHSITLGIAALGIFTPSPKFVEPAIALSIAYVGIENFFVKDGGKRWRITFPFGLIHGFGFAGALQEVNLSRAQVPAALVSFNLGVEAGQLFVLGLVLPMVFLVRQKEWFEPRGVRVVSGAIAAAGAFWFVTRIVTGG